MSQAPGLPPGGEARSQAAPAQAPLPTRALDDGVRVKLARGFRLQWEPAQSRHVLLFPEGVVQLNPSATEILQRCDGGATLGEVVADLERAFGTPGLRTDVHAFVDFALSRGWLRRA